MYIQLGNSPNCVMSGTLISFQVPPLPNPLMSLYISILLNELFFVDVDEEIVIHYCILDKGIICRKVYIQLRGSIRCVMSGALISFQVPPLPNPLMPHFISISFNELFFRHVNDNTVMLYCILHNRIIIRYY